MKVLPTILSGGSGTRLWPLSRKRWPKQFLALRGEEDLLTQTLRRVDRLSELLPSPFHCLPPLLLGSARQKDLLAERLPEKGRAVLEPCVRNTAPAVTLAALLEPEAVLLVLPSDHLIQDVATFAQVQAKAVQLAAEGYWITFGIVPSSPETGFGYLERGEPVQEGVFRLRRFVEKPDLETAKRYLESGEFFWNSGMFLFRADRWLEALEKLQPGMLRACREAVEKGRWEGRFFLPDERAFSRSPSDSIDYAVMERLGEISRGEALLLPLDVGWSDLGSFDSFWEVLPPDERGNLLVGDAVAIDTENTLLFGRDRLVAAVGVKDLIVVATRDAVLVLPKGRAQEVRKIVAELERQGRRET